MFNRIVLAVGTAIAITLGVFLSDVAMLSLGVRVPTEVYMITTGVMAAVGAWPPPKKEEGNVTRGSRKGEKK